MIEWFGPVIHEYYAGTEGNGFVYCNSEDWLAHPGTVGKAIIGTIHIVGDDGEEVPTGEPGTVYFEGDAASTFEYHNDPEKTASSRDPKGRGWSTLGDVGRLDEDGFLYRSEEHTSELQSLMRISYAVFCLKKKTLRINTATQQMKLQIH